MKKLIYVLSFALMVILEGSPVSAQVENEGIRFDSISFAEACAKAKMENKLVFIDCYVKTCAPCKMMSRKVFPQKICGDYFNSRFINLMKDMDEGEGPELRDRYGVKVYPTFLFIAPDGDMVLKYGAGAEKNAERFVSNIENALKAMEMYTEYSYGRNDIAFLGDLVSRLLKFDIRIAGEVIDKSLADAPAEVFADSVIWEALPKSINRTDGPAFRRMFDIRKQIGDITGRDSILGALVKTYSDEFTYRQHDWYDYNRRVNDLSILCAENAPGAVALRCKVLFFGEIKRKGSVRAVIDALEMLKNSEVDQTSLADALMQLRGVGGIVTTQSERDAVRAGLTDLLKGLEGTNRTKIERIIATL